MKTLEDKFLIFIRKKFREIVLLVYLDQIGLGTLSLETKTLTFFIDYHQL